MKRIKRIAATILSMAIILTMVAMPALAGEIMPFATGLEIKFTPPVAGQTVETVNKSFKFEPDSFVIEEKYWVPDGLLPTVLPSGETVGNINMGANGFEIAGKTVAVMKDTDTFKDKGKYLLVLSITNKEKIMDESSEIHLNGRDMVYEGYGDKDHTGKYLLFAELFTATSKDAPQAIFIATGADTGNLENVTNKTQYSLDGISWNDCTGTPTKLTGLSAGTIDVRYSDSPSNVQTIKITKADPPQGVGSTNCTTTKNNDGTITGLNTLMEYRSVSATGYTRATGATATDLAPGTYYVRVGANGSTLASGDVQVLIAEQKASVPVITAQPTDEENDTGVDALFIVEATGEDLKYEWHYIDVAINKEKIIETDNKYFEGQGTKTLKVKSVNNMKTGEFDCGFTGDQFYCIVSNAAGNVKTNVVTYKVNHVPGKEWKSDSSSHWQLCVCGKILNKAEHIDANNDGKCDVCGYDLSNSKVYNITFGQNSKWVKGSLGGLTFICDGSSANLKSVIVDDKEIKTSNYSITTDADTNNLVININADYLEELTPMSHSVTIKFADGSVTAQFEVDDESGKDDPTPQQPAIIWVIIAIAALALIAVIVLVILLVKRSKGSRK